MYRFLLAFLIILTAFSISIIASADDKPDKSKAGDVNERIRHNIQASVDGTKSDKPATQKKYRPAPFDVQEFVGTTIEARRLANIQNRRAAKQAHELCAADVQKDVNLKSPEEQELAAKVRCPAPPTHDYFLKAIDISCETGVYCGEKCEVTKRDLASFKAYFARKIRVVARAKKLGMHVDEVEGFVSKNAKEPQRLQAFWMCRVIDCWRENPPE